MAATHLAPASFPTSIIRESTSRSWILKKNHFYGEPTIGRCITGGQFLLIQFLSVAYPPAGVEIVSEKSPFQLALEYFYNFYPAIRLVYCPAFEVQ